MRRLVVCVLIALVGALIYFWPQASNTWTSTSSSHSAQNRTSSEPKANVPSPSSVGTPTIAAHAPPSQTQEQVGTRPSDALLAEAQEIKRSESTVDQFGGSSRVRILKTTFKYPLIRVTERLDSAGNASSNARRLVVADHLLVEKKPGVPLDDFDSELGKLGFSLIRRLRGSSVFLVRISTDSTQDLEKALGLLSQHIFVSRAEPDFVVSTTADPNDPQFSKQWSFKNTGQQWDSTDGADVRVLDAWPISEGSSSMAIGVVDTGIEYTHEDLKDGIWKNPKEKAGDGNSDGCPGNCFVDDDGDGLIDEDSFGCARNGKDLNGLNCTWKNDLAADDDENGYRDDFQGWNFFSDTNTPLDENGHGTHVAGIIGARKNNALGVAGIAPQVQLIPLQFLGKFGLGTISDAIEALHYAHSVSNCIATNNSWGGGGYSAILDAEVKAGASKGKIFVAAAGNESQNIDSFPSYPASLRGPNVISVAATNYYDSLASYSNYGVASVDLAAPGSTILSTFVYNSYGQLTGTSMAAPHVTGAVAALKALDPALTPVQIKARLLESADVDPMLAGVVAGSRRLNVARALRIGNAVAVSYATINDTPDGEIVANDDGIVSPGETVAFDLRVKNISSATQSSVLLNVSSPGYFLQSNFPKNEASIPSLAPGEIRLIPKAFLFSVPQDAAPGVYPLRLHVRVGSNPRTFLDQEMRIYSKPTLMTGTVRLDEQVYAGSAVTISGRVSAIRTVRADGSFRMGGPAGLYLMHAKLGAFSQSSGQSVSTPGAPAVTFDLVTAVRGTVLDSQTEEVVPDATLQRVDALGQIVDQYRTDSKGNYLVALEREKAESFWLRVKKPGFYIPTTVRVDVLKYGQSKSILLKAGALSFTPSKDISSGFPVIHSASTNGYLGGSVTRTIDGGTYTFAMIISPAGDSKEIASEIQQGVGDTGALTWQSQVTGINNGGEAVGTILLAGRYEGFFWSNGRAALLPPLTGYDYTVPTSINNSGEISGLSIHRVNLEYGYRLTVRPTRWTPNASAPRGYDALDLGDLSDTPSFYYAFPVRINDKHQVTGSSFNPSSFIHAYLWESGAMKDLGTLNGGSYTVPYAISPTGKIAGHANSGTNTIDGFLWSNNSMRPITTKQNFLYVQPTSIDDATESVAGVVTDQSFNEHPFLSYKGELFDPNELFLKNFSPTASDEVQNLSLVGSPFFLPGGLVTGVFYDATRATYLVGRTSSISSVEIPKTKPNPSPSEQPSPTPTATATPNNPTPTPTISNPTPTATNTPAPSQTPGVAPFPFPGASFVKGDFDGDGLSDLHVIRKPKRSAKTGQLIVYASKTKTLIRSPLSAVSGPFIEGRFALGANWQLAQLSSNSAKRLRVTPIGMGGRPFSFGRLGDSLVSGCDLLDADGVSDMLTVRSDGKMRVRSGTTRKVRSLTIPSYHRLLDAACYSSTIGFGERLALLVRSKSEKTLLIFDDELNLIATEPAPSDVIGLTALDSLGSNHRQLSLLFREAQSFRVTDSKGKLIGTYATTPQAYFIGSGQGGQIASAWNEGGTMRFVLPAGTIQSFAVPAELGSRAMVTRSAMLSHTTPSS